MEPRQVYLKLKIERDALEAENERLAKALESIDLTTNTAIMQRNGHCKTSLIVVLNRIYDMARIALAPPEGD